MANNLDEQNKLINVKDASRLPGYHYPQLDPAYLREFEEEDEVHLLDYWRVLIKRRWMILVFTFAVLLIVAIATWKTTPMFRATIKLQIDPEQTNILAFKDASEQGSNYAQSQEYLQTQFKVLESKSLASRVIRALNLDRNSKFMDDSNLTTSSKTMAWIRGVFGLGEQDDKSNDPFVAEERKTARLLKIFTESLTTSPVRNSRLVDVSFDARDPYLAAEVANTLANEYIQMNFETRFNATNMASDFLAKQIVDLKARVEKSEEELVRFSGEHDIYAISDKENVILQKLADLNTALTAVQAERIQKESTWNIVQQAGSNNLPDILRSNLITTLETNVSDLQVQKAKLEAQFKPGWPELDKVNGQLVEAEKQLALQKTRAIKNAETEYRTALQREKLLQKALNAQKVEANAFNQNSIQYNILKRQVDTDKQLYDGLLQRMKEAGVSAGLKSSNIHVVDQAAAPRTSFKPNKVLNLSLALAIGLMLGISLAFFVEYLDSSIKTPDDVERFVKLPSLGVIPSAASFLTGSQRRLLAASTKGSNGSTGNPNYKAVELIAFYDAKSLLSEAYRNLRTSILLSSGSGRPPKILLITSSQMGEGKTTTAINIGITLAQTGNKVILLDCDMRNPRLHRALGMENGSGMSTFLSGNTDLASMIQQTEIPNLFAVPAGLIPPNPAELAGSPRLKQGLTLLDDYFDHIIIDSPPVLSVTDARILSTLVDGVILVIKGGETPKEAVQRTKHLLQEVHAHIIGTMLNNVDIRSADYHYYSKYYYYGYGKKYGKGHEAQSQQEKPHDSA
jgi:polysaccharide biosynthesis transport protein